MINKKEEPKTVPYVVTIKEGGYTFNFVVTQSLINFFSNKQPNRLDIAQGSDTRDGEDGTKS